MNHSASVSGSVTISIRVAGPRMGVSSRIRSQGRFPRRSDVWVLPLFGDRKPFPLAQTQFIETSGVFSPDGRWIAYTSNESGQPNVYVQPFPGPAGSIRCHGTEEAIRSGERMARNCFIWRPGR